MAVGPPARASQGLGSLGGADGRGGQVGHGREYETRFGAHRGYGMADRIRIRLKAFDHWVVDQTAADSVRTAQKTGASVRGPVLRGAGRDDGTAVGTI